MVSASVNFRRECPRRYFGSNGPDLEHEGRWLGKLVDSGQPRGRWPCLWLDGRFLPACPGPRSRRRSRHDLQAVAIETNAGGRPVRGGREGLGGAARRAAAWRAGGPSGNNLEWGVECPGVRLVKESPRTAASMRRLTKTHRGVLACWIARFIPKVHPKNHRKTDPRGLLGGRRRFVCRPRQERPLARLIGKPRSRRPSKLAKRVRR